MNYTTGFGIPSYFFFLVFFLIFPFLFLYFCPLSSLILSLNFSSIFPYITITYVVIFFLFFVLLFFCGNIILREFDIRNQGFGGFYTHRNFQQQFLALQCSWCLFQAPSSYRSCIYSFQILKIYIKVSDQSSIDPS